jgi:hypothetical protein
MDIKQTALNREKSTNQTYLTENSSIDEIFN